MKYTEKNYQIQTIPPFTPALPIHQLQKSNRPFVFFLGAENSGSAYIVKNMLEDLSKVYPSQIDFFYTTREQSPALYDHLRIRQHPTIYFFRNAELVQVVHGILPICKLRTYMNKLLIN